MASFVNYFQERKNGDAADGDPAFVPPMVGEAEVIFTTAEAVAVKGKTMMVHFNDVVSNFFLQKEGNSLGDLRHQANWAEY